MTRNLTLFSFVFAIVVVFSAVGVAQKKRVVVHPVRHPRAHLVVHPRHPIRRTLPARVVVHPARRAVVVNRPLVYLPAVAWRPAVVTLPPAERFVWQDTETITSEEEWVDTNFGVDAPGNALYLDLNGRARLNFAEVTFANGQVQVVDFNESTRDAGVYRVLDFADGRHVSNVRILAKSETPETRMVVYLSK
jgi:hypothetical protein